MRNELLVNLVDSVLGKGKNTARGNKAYHCPYCNHYKKKLEINFIPDKKGRHFWNCWVCQESGTQISKIFNKVGASLEKKKELSDLIKKETPTNFLSKKNKISSIQLPKEFKPLFGDNSFIAKKAKSYLKTRGVYENDIIKYNIGYCNSGEYNNMIIIPSYDSEGKLNYFSGRSFEKNSYIKHKNPGISRDIIAFELFINWDLPIILTEAPLDAISIKRNVIPLLGNNIQPQLIKKLLTSSIKKIYIALDPDALKHVLKHANFLLNQGKEVYLIELKDKDPNELGFEEFTKKSQSIFPLDQKELLRKKLQLL